MKIIEHMTQGSDVWHAHRATARNASEAPALMGVSPFLSRQELLRQKATGYTPDVDAAKQRLFDRGHAAEAAARLVIEQALGEDFFTVVATTDDGYLSASMDGLNMAGDTIFEHKLFNATLAESVRNEELPPMYYWQLEQQLLVSGADKVIFVCSDGTDDNWEQMEYRAVPGRAEQLIAAWRQFDEDLANYKHVEVIPAAVAAPTEGFGALVLQVEGRVVACNIDAFRAGAAAFLNRLPKPEELNSDQDFANADSAAKACAEAEAKIKAAKDAGLAQMNEVDTVFRVADQIIAEIAAARIALTKSVDARKVTIRNEIVQSAKDRLTEHIATLNKRLGRVQMPAIPADFVGAIKGKRTVESLKNAVDTVLANSKITANEIADKIQINLAALDENKEFAFLFNDIATLVMKAPDDLANVIKLRIAEHHAEQQRKLEAERERIRKEEQAKAEREQQEKAAAEKREAERIAAEQEKQKAEQAKSEPQQDATPTTMEAGKPAVERSVVAAPVHAPTVSQPQAQDDTAWKIAGVVAEMTEQERVLVLHYCHRVIEQRKEAA